MSSEAWVTWSLTSWMARSISVIEAAVSSAMRCTSSALSATWRMLAPICWLDELADSTAPLSDVTLRATSSTELPSSSVEDEASSVERESVSICWFTLRTDWFTRASMAAVSSAASSWLWLPSSISCMATPRPSETEAMRSVTSTTRPARLPKPSHMPFRASPTPRKTPRSRRRTRAERSPVPMRSTPPSSSSMGRRALRISTQ
ncbi:MAG: hypothetical protein JRF70_17310 [Deltaproteobacteria bacterium]|nr:hypothetical protein [Deltaproteobacteria bacterium]